MAGNVKHVVNMANSIVGVSILSMPYCFKETGLVLGILLVLLSGLVTKKTCMFLIRSAIMARRRSYEFLAFHVFGVSGKLFVELCMILFLIGICISFHVVMGDLAPAIVARLMDIENSPSLRCTLLIGISLLVVLPLCLLRNLDSLASMSACSIGFYFLLILVILYHAFSKLMDGSWYHMAELFRPSGALHVLPICMLGLSCQSNVFEIYDSIPDPDVPKMRSVVNHAVNLCCALYISVGFLGYVAFVDQDLAGNVILSFPNSQMTEGIKVFFTVSLAISFPLMIFPCRTSIHSLLYRRNNPSSFDLVGNYMPESRFKGITIGILTTSLIVGILIPNIEFVLGLLGSTMGMLIALILPSLLFIRVNSKASAERLLAQGIMLVGVVLIVTGTYLTLAHINQVQTEPQVPVVKDLVKNGIDPNLPNIERNVADEGKVGAEARIGDSATRREPVAPEPPPEGIERKDEPDDANQVLKAQDKTADLKETKDEKENVANLNKMEVKEVIGDQQKLENVRDEKNGGDTLHPDAIKKEEKVNKEEGNEIKEVEKKQAELLEIIEVQFKEQKKIIAEQKQILQELKDQKAMQKPEVKIQDDSGRVAADVKPAAEISNVNLAAVHPEGENLGESAVINSDKKSGSGNIVVAPLNPEVANPAAGNPGAVAQVKENLGPSVLRAGNNVPKDVLEPAVFSKNVPAGELNKIIAPPAQENQAQLPGKVIPQQSFNYKVKEAKDIKISLPNYPISGNHMPDAGSLVNIAINPENSANKVRPAALVSHDNEQAMDHDVGKLQEKLPPAGQPPLPDQSQPVLAGVKSHVKLGDLAPQDQLSAYQPKNEGPALGPQSQDKLKVSVYQLKNTPDVVPKEESLLQQGRDIPQAVDIKKAPIPKGNNKQANIGRPSAMPDTIPKMENHGLLSVNNKENILPSENGKKTNHDEERRKRQADTNYFVDLPEVDLNKEIKPLDTVDVAYDTRHLLWNSRSRRKRRRNDRGREDDYYWDET
nr:putative sodium-coupled neutral amino acid transporter 10 isoform X2 [Procambarus clarkii]